jgi:phosphinothricin acetyltransferase
MRAALVLAHSESFWYLAAMAPRTADIQLSPITPADRPAMLDLFNYYVGHGFAAFPEQPLPLAFIDRLLDLAKGYPALAVKDRAGRLLGFGLLRPHNPLPTFAHTAEITCFLAPDCTRQGLGTRLWQELERQATEKGIRTILAGISSLNDGSLAFHRRHGFVEAGRFRQIAIKKGTAFDVVWMQKML